MRQGGRDETEGRDEKRVGETRQRQVRRDRGVHNKTEGGVMRQGWVKQERERQDKTRQGETRWGRARADEGWTRSDILTYTVLYKHCNYAMYLTRLGQIVLAIRPVCSVASKRIRSGKGEWDGS